MKTYKISKNYTGFPSKNIPNYETGLTIEDAKHYLKHQAKRCGNLGGSIVEKDETSLTVEESNGEGRIVFEINEEL